MGEHVSNWHESLNYRVSILVCDVENFALYNLPTLLEFPQRELLREPFDIFCYKRVVGVNLALLLIVESNEFASFEPV